MDYTLPNPEKNLSGWPWNDTIPTFPPLMSDGSRWPKISIVTPSFNQAQYLEETIRSVLFQGYPNLEYIIIDGGSTDGSVEIIKKYETRLKYWVSEPDRGQSHALTKGFDHSSGELMAWINSDDFYLPGSFKLIADIYHQKNSDWIAGRSNYINADGQLTKQSDEPLVPIESWFIHNYYAQPSVFWTRTLWNKTKGIDQKMQFSFDYELWLQFMHFQSEALWIDASLAVFRIHPRSKTSTEKVKFLQEDWKVQKRHLSLVKSIPEKIKIIITGRTRLANAYLSHNSEAIPLCIKVLLSVWYAPWLIFTRAYYYKVKRLVSNGNSDIE